MTWDGQLRRLFQRVTTADVTILSAQGQYDGWNIRLLAPERERISRANDIISDLECAAEFRSISPFRDRHQNRSKLTDKQRETLITGIKMGYYDIPREITMEELADVLGIYHQALSERFRRAHHHLIESTLTGDEEL